MASQRINVVALTMARRMMSTGAKVESVAQTKHSIDMTKFDPNNYSIPVRPITMNDTMEPYGDWKTAYAAEKRNANMTLLKGIASFTCACMVVYYGGLFEGVILPNLDNIMEDTEPFDFEKEEGRVSV